MFLRVFSIFLHDWPEEKNMPHSMGIPCVGSRRGLISF